MQAYRLRECEAETVMCWTLASWALGLPFLAFFVEFCVIPAPLSAS
jgi:hypothetical protein